MDQKENPIIHWKMNLCLECAALKCLTLSLLPFLDLKVCVRECTIVYPFVGKTDNSECQLL